VKNIAAGRLPLNSSPKSQQVKLLSNPEFQGLIATFRRISEISDLIERDFELGRSARDHGTPRGDFRRLFRQWIERQGLGGGT
jgi:hypothetical protein